MAVDLSVVHTFGSAVGERALRKRNEKITQAFIRGHGGWTLFHPFRVRDIWPCRPGRGGSHRGAIKAIIAMDEAVFHRRI